MDAHVFAADEQTDHPVETLRWIRLAEAVLAEEGVGDAEVSLLFVDETTIADLNKRFLEREGPTDVLAFPIDESPSEGGRSPDSGGSGPGASTEVGEAPALLGDIVICPAVADRNAPDHAGTYDDELALLVVHGLLHLLGMDHEDDEEAEAMEARERDLLARHHGAVPAVAPADGGASSDGAAPGPGGPDAGGPSAGGPDVGGPDGGGPDAGGPDRAGP